MLRRSTGAPPGGVTEPPLHPLQAPFGGRGTDTSISHGRERQARELLQENLQSLCASGTLTRLQALQAQFPAGTKMH
jgi:hypothetical protein